MDKKSKIRQILKDGESDEFSYHTDEASINAVETGEHSAKIGHFVVKRDERRKGIGSTVFESLIKVLREEDYSTVTVEIQAIDEGSKDDSIMRFLEHYGFKYVKKFRHHNWGICVRAVGHI